jgi:2-keto-4-pentenoate hydratase/2-oxohepta-3-ene-1,7-dioic acid hydratase in catechol pathway
MGLTGKIFCIGLNYRDHAVDSGVALPKEPVFQIDKRYSVKQLVITPQCTSGVRCTVSREPFPPQ